MPNHDHEREPPDRSSGMKSASSIQAAVDGGDAMVETPQALPDESDLGEILAYRLRQQTILSDFGVEALRSRDLDALLQRATELCAQGMGASLCKLLHYCPDTNDLLLRAGVGWEAGAVGHETFGADMASPAGYALKTGDAVISNHLGGESRFRTPDLMARHAVKRAINVVIEAEGRHWGVLEVDSRDEGRFEKADLAFMRGFANLIGVAIERQVVTERLEQAVAHQSLLVRETSHRVKNSLALVASLLDLQARDAAEEQVAAALREARARISAIAEVHDRIWRSEEQAHVDLAELLPRIVAGLRPQAPEIRVDLNVQPIVLSSERAMSVGLLVTELVTNAFKHAYPDRRGVVRVFALTIPAQAIEIGVEDEGVGLPPGFDPHDRERASLGLRVATSLAAQLGGRLAASSSPGARFAAVFPYAAAG
jgi:two-component sensor histidine kinase